MRWASVRRGGMTLHLAAVTWTTRHSGYSVLGIFPGFVWGSRISEWKGLIHTPGKEIRAGAGFHSRKHWKELIFLYLFSFFFFPQHSTSLLAVALPSGFRIKKREKKTVSERTSRWTNQYSQHGISSGETQSLQCPRESGSRTHAHAHAALRMYVQEGQEAVAGCGGRCDRDCLLFRVRSGASHLLWWRDYSLRLRKLQVNTGKHR